MNWVSFQARGVIAVRIAACQPVNAQAEQFMQVVAHLAWLSPIHQASRERFQQAEALVGCALQDRAAIA
jgi:hypothetical protein